jgi:hypothetical protein
MTPFAHNFSLAGRPQVLRYGRGQHGKHVPRPTGEGTASPVSPSFQKIGI